MRQPYLLILLLLGLQLVPQAGHAAAADNEKVTAAELEDIVAELNDLDSWFDEAANKRQRLEREIRDKDKEVATVGQNVRKAQQALTRAKQDLTDIGYQRQLLTEQRAVQAQRIGEHLAAAYRLRGQDLIKQLLNQESPEELARMLRYHRVLSGARLEALEKFEDTVRQLEDNRRALEAKTQSLAQEQEKLQTRQQALVAQRDTRKKLINQLAGEVESRTQQQQRLLANRGRLENLLVKLRARTPELDGEAFAANKGKLPWPITGKVAASFGSSRNEGQMKWQGVLFGATEGDPVRAVYPGKVIFADWLRGYGLLIIVDHGSSYMTLYGNADGLLKNLGDWVEAGELIAQAGSSGGQASSGLYFEIRHDGKVSNPLAWLVKP